VELLRSFGVCHRLGEIGFFTLNFRPHCLDVVCLTSRLQRGQSGLRYDNPTLPGDECRLELLIAPQCGQRAAGFFPAAFMNLQCGHDRWPEVGLLTLDVNNALL
jgi:hypothetical protein